MGFLDKTDSWEVFWAAESKVEAFLVLVGVVAVAEAEDRSNKEVCWAACCEVGTLSCGDPRAISIMM